MTTDDFTIAARAKAEDRWWNGAVPKDANPPQAWILGFQEGAPWARDHLAAQEATALSALRAAIDGPHPEKSGLDSYTLAYVSARLDEFDAALVADRAVGRDAR